MGVSFPRECFRLSRERFRCASGVFGVSLPPTSCGRRGRVCECGFAPGVFGRPYRCLRASRPWPTPRACRRQAWPLSKVLRRRSTNSISSSNRHMCRVVLMDFKRLSTCSCAADSALDKRRVLASGWRCSISDRGVATMAGRRLPRCRPRTTVTWRPSTRSQSPRPCRPCTITRTGT